MRSVPDLPRLGFLHWVSPAPSGGNRYDAELLAGLRRLGAEVRGVRVRSRPDDEAGVRSEVAAALPRERRWLIDGIIACAVPDLIQALVVAGGVVVVVVHHFGADAPDLDSAARTRQAEREAAGLRVASGVLCTSGWAATEVRRRYEIQEPVVAAPGVEPAGLAPGHRTGGSPRLLSVGSLTPVKDQLTLVNALRLVADLDWTARIVGGDTVDPAYAAELRSRIQEAGLVGRIEVPGALGGDKLAAEWAATDLLVHPSRSETYGLVVLEALARGIPAVVTDGTGLVEALQVGRCPGDPLAGARIPPGRPDDLAGTLREWLTSDDLAATWRAAATAQRDRLPDWTQTAAAVLEQLPSAGAAST